MALTVASNLPPLALLAGGKSLGVLLILTNLNEMSALKVKSEDKFH